MIESINGQRMIFGYGRFQTMIEDFEETEKPVWLRPLLTFFTNFEVQKDFRFERFSRLQIALLELIKYLDEDYYNLHLKTK